MSCADIFEDQFLSEDPPFLLYDLRILGQPPYGMTRSWSVWEAKSVSIVLSLWVGGCLTDLADWPLLSSSFEGRIS